MRLRPLTCNLPKPMLPLVNRPFIEHVLGHLKRHGITDVILSAGYLSTTFIEHLKKIDNLGLNLELVIEEEPLGTCGAVKNVSHLLNETFMVFNGDILTDLNLSHLLEYHKQKKALATIALTSVDDPTSYGLVPLNHDGVVENFVEKPNWDDVTTDLINAGTYILEPEALDLAPAGENYSFERGLFPLLLEKDLPIYGFPSSSYWLDIGSPEKFIRAHHDLLEGKIVFDHQGEEIGSRVWAGEGSVVDPSATIYGPVVMGRKCQVDAHAVVVGPTSLGDSGDISAGARVEGSIMLDGCQLADSVVVKNSILGHNIKVGRKVHIDDVSVLGDNLTIGEENRLKHGIKIWPDTQIAARTIQF